MSEYQGQVEFKTFIIRGRNFDFNVLKEKALEALTIFEDMFKPSLSGTMVVRDEIDWGNQLPFVGEETLFLDIEVKDTGIIQVPPLSIYSVKEIKRDEPATRYWELSFSSYGHVGGKWNDSHLYEDFEGPIHEFVQKLYDGAKEDFEDSIGEGEEYGLEIEETGNNIVYKNQYAEYPSLRIDGPRDVHTLINQCAENATNKDNPNAVNFMFYQDMYGWKFKSIESMMDGDSVEVFCENVYADGVADSGLCGLKSRQIIGRPKIIKMGNRLELASRGAWSSMFNYSPPRIDVEKYPYWMVSSIETFYYKVNCRFLDRFPAAIVGFKRASKSVDENPESDVHRWHYAFAEVYLEYNYETHTPMFRIKPLSENPIRSNIKFTEEGIEEQEDVFYEPAHNTMEIGNDGYYDNNQRLGWEAPGVRIDTKMWEESCFKIQPIRGSHPMRGGEGNNTDEDDDWDWVDDNVYPMGYWPIVDMKIYKDVEGQPHYFFTAENSADGECNEDDANDDCPQVPEA